MIRFAPLLPLAALLIVATTTACTAPTAAPLTPPPAGSTSPAVASSPSAASSPAASAPSAAPAGASPAAQQAAGVTSNQEAAQEIVATRLAYEEAQRAFQQGDKARALDLMNTAYLDHFERVEPWMDQNINQAFRQEVEAAISRDLRRKLRDGGPDAEISSQFPIAFQKLTDAEQRLSGR